VNVVDCKFANAGNFRQRIGWRCVNRQTMPGELGTLRLMQKVCEQPDHECLCMLIETWNWTSSGSSQLAESCSNARTLMTVVSAFELQSIAVICYMLHFGRVVWIIAKHMSAVMEDLSRCAARSDTNHDSKRGATRRRAIAMAASQAILRWHEISCSLRAPAHRNNALRRVALEHPHQ
jgi:hypothetical protein